MKILRPLVGVLLIFNRLAADPAAGPMLYPHAPAPGAGVGGDHGGIGMTGLLGVLLAAAGGAWLFWSRQRGRQRWGARSERLLSIAETRPLGNRQYLVVAAYGKRRFLLGVCAARIDLLAPLDDEDATRP